jgi:hypothetical protein
MYHQDGYNIKEGGSAGKLPKDIRERIGNKIKEKWKNPEYKEKMTKHLKNMTEETKLKMSEAKNGIKLSESHKKNISKSLKGKSKPEGVGKKISAAKTGMKYNWKNKRCYTQEKKDEILRNNNAKKREERKIASYNFKLKGPVKYVICNNTGEVFSSFREASKKLNIHSQYIKEQIMGIYKQYKGYTFTAIHNNPENEGENHG